MLPQKLAKKRVIEINERIMQRFGVDPQFRTLFSKGNWIYAYTGGIVGIKASSIGLNIGRFREDFMPTIEGAQIINPKKNFFMLKDNECALKWMQGNDIEAGSIDCEKGYVIIKRGEDILGAGIYDGKTINNRLAKNRKITI